MQHRTRTLSSVSAHKTSGHVKQSDAKRVLLLGAGFVTGPIVEYFGRISNVHVTAASALQSDLDRLIAAGPHVSPIVCDVQANPEALETLVRFFIENSRPRNYR